MVHTTCTVQRKVHGECTFSSGGLHPLPDEQPKRNPAGRAGGVGGGGCGYRRISLRISWMRPVTIP